MDADKDWKKSVGFPINYSPEHSDDDFDQQDVVMRHPRQSEMLLPDFGDGAEADLLGTTPPRQRIRDKKKRRAYMDAASTLRDSKDAAVLEQVLPDRPRSRLTLKIQRARERDFKQGVDQRDKADSLPSPNPRVAVPTLVESCSRFMSLTSRLKCRETHDEEPEETSRADEEFPPSRVNFHKTFSMLINMGNIDKGCRRTISHEEQVWQNELKDLIWLELQAKIAGRTLAEQDAFLCAQRNIVPAIIQNIRNYRCRKRRLRVNEPENRQQYPLTYCGHQQPPSMAYPIRYNDLQAKIAGRTFVEQDAFLCAQENIVPAIIQNIRNYRFVNPNPCRSHTRSLGVIEGSTEDLREKSDSGTELDDDSSWCCVAFNCRECSEAVGKAMREVGTLLDSYHNALSLYPSSHAMTADHPLVATQLFKNTLKAMCLWYNTAMHMRLKIIAVRRMIRTMKLKLKRRGFRHLTSSESEASRRQSFDSPRPCQVRFNVSTTPSSSNNSDSSGQTEIAKEKPLKEPQTESQEPKTEMEEEKDTRSQELENGVKDVEENDKDVTDSSCVKNEQSAPTTPEIVISDSKYGTTDTTTSNESGYTSAADPDNGKQTDDVYDIGSLEDLTELRLLNKCEVSIYRSYHHEILKTQGVRRCMLFINKMRCYLLNKVHQTLEKPNDKKLQCPTEELEDPVEVFDDTKEEENNTDCPGGDEDAKKNYELKRYGCCSEECLTMRLPSYRNHFLLLSTICMEAVHDYLSLRLEDRPLNPSCLTVKQEIDSLKARYKRMLAEECLTMRLNLCNEIVNPYLGIFLPVSCSRTFLIHELKEGLDIATESRAAFARNIEVALAGHSASAGARQDLLLIVRTFDTTVETVLKQYLSYLRTMSEVEQMGKVCLQSEWAFTARLAKRVRCAALLAPQTFSEIACNQLDRLYKQFDQKFEQVIVFEKSTADPDKHFVYSICRSVQQIYSSERDATLQAAHWARCLAARLARAARPDYTTQRANIFDSLMRIRDLIVSQTNHILERSRNHDDKELSKENLEALGARVRELMLQIYRLGFEIHKDLHRFVHDSSRPAYRRSVNASPPKGNVRKFNRSESIGEDAETNVFDDRLFENINNFGDNQSQSSLELLLTGEEPQDEVILRSRPVESRLSEEERKWATVVARAVVEFAKCWMQFVIERCDKGRGLRPRWACQGLEFLMLACDPCNTKHLTEEEFEDLKKKMDGCISHVIGSRPVTPRIIDNSSSTPEHAHRRRPRLHSPLPSAGGNLSKSVPAPPTPPVEPEPLFNFPGVDSAAYSARVLEATKHLDEEREQKLLEARAVGRVLESTVSTFEPKLRQLKFKWQRGLKIGAGTFGKVYTVVNTETGQLLAMKEISLGVGDRRALQRAANELRVLEGVIHPHLVRYYGCELHREEMLIFMELCVEGSLEALIATSGGLEEHMTRRYTKQLVSAVAELHARGIAHRDIKSGNIFLTNEGHCLKLGDFGCAVKIRANTTAAGELMGHVGTQAYMAPEVFMKSTGHGRAADIWSLGCVVTEMASGKRPFSEYDSNVQIMFVVGMGGRPNIPETLSEEGQSFCQACLTHEPEKRPRAEQLSLHHFLMLKSDDDCRCEPAFLIT